MSYLLGIDYGLKRMGVSVGQTITCRARSLGGLYTQPEKQRWKQLDALINRWKPVGLVFGKPLDKDGGMQPMMYTVFDFVWLCIKRYNTKAYWIDERYTTLSAKSDLGWRFSSQQAKRDRLLVDGQSAMLILSDWLALTDQQKEQSIVPNSIT